MAEKKQSRKKASADHSALASRKFPVVVLAVENIPESERIENLGVAGNADDLALRISQAKQSNLRVKGDIKIILRSPNGDEQELED